MTTSKHNQLKLRKKPAKSSHVSVKKYKNKKKNLYKRGSFDQGLISIAGSLKTQNLAKKIRIFFLWVLY